MSIKTLPLTIVGAAENNLKDVSLELEHDTYTVVTGLSGSGKSSLAFSTVYAEGQRRYIETFSPYTRQFLDRLKKPNVLSVENVRPAIAIQQKTRVVSSRSTVGSMTNANDLLKILYANLAEPHSPTTGEKLVSFSSSDIVDALILWEQKAPQGLTGLVAAPLQLPSTKKGRTQELARLSLLGFSRCFDTCSRSIKKIETLSPGDISGDELLLVLTRFQTGKIKAKELRESVTQAYELSRGKAAVIFPDVDKNVLTSLPRIDGEMARFSETYQTADAHSEQLPFEIPKRRAPLFDPNSNIGACPKCTGFGYVLELDEKKLVPNDSLSLQQGAIHPWRTSSDANLEKKLFRFCEAHKISLDQPWRALSPMKRELIMEHKERGYTGLIPWFRWLERKSYKMHVRVFLSRYRSQFLCELCAGGRLKPEALCFKIAGKNLHDIWNTPVQEVLDWSEDLLQKLDGSPHQSRDLREVAERLKGRLLYLRDLGLPYITLGRPSRTLSGGETQRVNLTTALGSELVSTHFVLDEPSVGLHPRDTERLMKSMRELQQKGNSVLVVEHDTDCIAAADRIVELGPKAGNEGGKIVFNGPISEWGGIEDRAELPKPRTLPKEFPKLLTLSGASSRNLKDISVSLPIGFFSVITGVSGSGKSTLVTEELLPAWEEFTQRGTTSRCSGFENFKQVLLVDQSSLTKSPRANIATYTGVWDAFRTALSSTESAEKRSLTKSSFSFNVEGGRCPVCKGAGYLKEDMQFLSDVYVQCEECLGHRFQPKVLEVTYEEKNVSDWLNCSISELPSLLPDQRTISRVAEYLTILGLGHLRLGHPLSELSGGEAQRLKLVPFLEKADRGESLLIFDEPTTGLHLHDVRKLIALLRDLTVRGHTVLCIEHNQELILGADHIIDLGPEGGDLGGQVLLAGPPDAFLTNTESPSYTAQFLKDYVVAAKEGQRLRAPQKKESTSIGLQPLLIRGAREHNLKNIDVELPHNEVIAITGVSGSGKSTLAKDIIYAEGQRRYLDCLSPYARQFIRELTKPDVDEIKNIRPTVCVYQHTFQPGKRSTLGTMSEVYNFLRLLYSKAGAQYCPDHPDRKVEALSSELIADEVIKCGDTPVKLLAPVIKGRKGNHKDIFRRAVKSEIFEVRVDGVFRETGSLIAEGLERTKQHDIDYVWATVTPSRVPKELITNAVEEVFAISGGTIAIATDKSEQVFSRERACPICKRGFFRPDPEDLSFHSRRGRCERCDGTGIHGMHTCSSCNGSRLKSIGRSVRVHGLNIAELCEKTAPEIRMFLSGIRWDNRLAAVTKPIYQEVYSRLTVLERIGLDYLPLSRSCETLSSGEMQRLRLAAALGTPLNGALYIFDEPSAGLHPDDNNRVLGEFAHLKERENTVLLIEHDEHTIQSADYVLEVGPEGGSRGGEIAFHGPIGKYPGVSSGDELLGISREREDAGSLSVQITHLNNISEFEVEIPLKRFVTIAGVSGAGKSTLVHEAMLPLVMDACELGRQSAENDFAGIELSEELERVLVIDQSPIGRNSRSTPASYLKLFDDLRKLFASTVEAKARGWTASFFSYNSGNGRCPQCKGLGRTQLEMSFLSEAFVTCEFCRGDRYADEALSIHYQGRTIADVLKMTFDEAKEAFAAHRNIHRLVRTACELGLGYLTLGQSSVTLSGGESQRMKLITELAKPPRGHTFYVLDEPTIGLHRKDVSKLLKVLHSLVALGNTVLVIEHDRDVLEHSDHVIEMGPGPGADGGKVIFEGTPEELAKSKTPWGVRLRREKLAA